MASVGNGRCRKKAVRSTTTTVQVTASRQAATPAETIPIPPICAVVNSLKLPISSVPALLNPSNNVQLLSTPQLKQVIRFGEFQDNLQAFIKELQESELAFHEEVAKINAADRLIFKNSSFLECLHHHIQELGKTSKDVDTDLNKLFSELNLLEETVRNLETRFDGDINHQLNCLDRERRENLYNFIVQLDANMNHLAAQLSEIICLNNSQKSGGCLETDPVQQIGCILNHNLEALVHCEKAIVESKVQMDTLSSLQKEILRQCASQP